MILLSFILLASGGLLYAEAFRQSQRGMQGLVIRSPLRYNYRGILQITAVLIMLAAVLILFWKRWWLGLVGLVVAWVGTILHVGAFIRMDPELRTRLFAPEPPTDP
jgi:CHASE2 domain-containing sensor protein